MARSTFRDDDQVGSIRTERADRWRVLLEEWRQSGLSQAEFCRRRNLAPVSLSWWKRRLAKVETSGKRRRRRAAHLTEEPRFVALRLIEGTGAPEASPVPTATAAASVAVIELVLRGERRVRVPAGFDLEHLRQILRALEVEPC